MPKKLDAAAFLAGREAYLDKTPLLQLVDQMQERDAADTGEAFACGWFDGLLTDIRDCAQNARDELAERRTQYGEPSGC